MELLLLLLLLLCMSVFARSGRKALKSGESQTGGKADGLAGEGSHPDIAATVHTHYFSYRPSPAPAALPFSARHPGPFVTNVGI